MGEEQRWRGPALAIVADDDRAGRGRWYALGGGHEAIGRVRGCACGTSSSTRSLLLRLLVCPTLYLHLLFLWLETIARVPHCVLCFGHLGASLVFGAHRSALFAPLLAQELRDLCLEHGRLTDRLLILGDVV